MVSLTTAVQNARFAADDTAIDFTAGEALYRYQLATGEAQVVAVKYTKKAEADTEAAAWLAQEQRTLLQHIDGQEQRNTRANTAGRLNNPALPQPLPVAPGETIDQIQRSPDGRYITFRTRRRATNRPPTQYVDYVDASGYSQVHDARAKVGEPP